MFPEELGQSEILHLQQNILRQKSFQNTTRRDTETPETIIYHKKGASRLSLTVIEKFHMHHKPWHRKSRDYQILSRISVIMTKLWNVLTAT